MTDEHDLLKARVGLLVPINNLEPTQQEQVIRAAELVDLKKKDYVFRQGDRDRFSYYVLEGEVELYADDQLIKRVVGGEGASFHALAQLQPRQMSARAKTKVRVLKIDRGLLDRLLSVEKALNDNPPEIEVTEIETSVSGDWLTEMLQSELFAHVPPSNIQKLLETLETIAFKAGDVVIEQGAPGDYYYAVQAGRCEVLRMMKNNKPIKLAELGPGDRFGEEALVSDAKRNATVKMLTDGELARLTKDDFIELIKKPVMRVSTLEEARSLVAAGAQWLDVRFPEEHQTNGLPESLNIPLSNLRGSHQQLEPNLRYVVYCDTGGRSSAAAFLLTQEGFDVSYVDGGAIDEVPPEQAQSALAKKASAKRETEKTPAVAPAPSAQDAIIEADIRAQSLAADLEKAKLQIAQAQRLMAEANAAKLEADRLVAEKLKDERAKIETAAAAVAERLAEADRVVADKLQVERAKIEQEAAAMSARSAEAERLGAEKLHAERAKLESEAAVVAKRLQEAERLKDEIQRQQALAEEDARRRHEEQAQETSALKREAELLLRNEKDRIEELYRLQAEKLDEFEQARERSKSELSLAWAAIESESTLTQERLEAAKELEDELLRKEQLLANDMEEREGRMRAAMQAELAAERKKLEAQFAKTAEQLENARRAQGAAAAAKKAATAEAQHIIHEYKEAQAKIQADQHAKLLDERRKIEADAARLKIQLEEAAKAREEAQAMKREAEAQLAETRRRHDSVDATEVNLRAEIVAIEERARAATERLRKAVAVETSAARDIRASEDRLERTYGTDKEINILLQKELDDWVAEQERLQASTARRNDIEKQIKQTERIKVRAVQAQHDSASHDANLLDEIAAQLESHP